MNTSLYQTVSNAIDVFWAENDIYIMLATLIIFALIGMAYICVLYYEWLFNLIEEDNERTYYTSTQRRHGS